MVVPRTVVPRLSVVTTRCERPGPERTFAMRTHTRRVCTTFDVEAKDCTGDRTEFRTEFRTWEGTATPRDSAADAVEDSAVEDSSPEDSAVEDAGLGETEPADTVVDGTDRASATAAAQQEPRSRQCGWWCGCSCG